MVIKPCIKGPECVDSSEVTGAAFNTETEEGNFYTHQLCTACNGYLPIGPSTDYESLDRGEKQTSYELWAAANAESKLGRRIRRNHMLSKFLLRHSQIKAEAKKRGKPVVKARSPKLSMRRQRRDERLAAAWAESDRIARAFGEAA